MIYLMNFCGACRSCRVGATNQCLAKRGDVGQNVDGGYGPYALVHESQFFPVPAELDLGTATMLLDVMGTSSHAIARASSLRPDIESAYVAGAGPIGLGLLVMLKVRFGRAFPVAVSDVSPWRRKMVEKLGGDPIDALDRDAVLSRRPDISFDSSGRQSARELALAATGKRGALICIGHGQGLQLDVSADLIAPERAVIGSEYFRYDEMAENLDLLLDNEDFISRVITHRLPVDRIDEAFELFFSGETGKVVITQ